MIELTKEYIDHLKDIITEKDDAKIRRYWTNCIRQT